MSANYVSNKLGFADSKLINQFALDPNSPRLLEAFADYLEALCGKRKIVVVDLFCGGGGFTTGAIQAGAVVALSIDLWEPAEKVHHENHPTVPFIKMALGDIEADVQLILEYIQPYVEMGYHFHLHGSPPCQAISTASRRHNSEGMPMVMHYLELVDRLEPDSWSMENVPPVRKLLPEYIPAVMLNSAEFGVAQQRRRCFAGEGWEVTRTHSNHNLKGNKNKHLPNFRTVLDALPHLREEYIELLKSYDSSLLGAPLELWDKVIQLASGTIDLLINTAGGGASDGKRVTSVDTLVSEPCKTIHNNIPSIRVREDSSIDMTLNNAGVADSNSQRALSSEVSVEQPSNTITGKGVTLRTNIGDGVNYRKVRSLTIDEMATLQDFPTDYSFDAAKFKKDRYLVVGNAVCPAVAKAVIEGIKIGGNDDV